MPTHSIETKYHLEVSHKPGEFVSDMDYLTQSPQEALAGYIRLQKKYPDRKINIIEITTRIIQKSISPNQLEIRATSA